MTGRPRSTSEVTPWSAMPQGTIPRIVRQIGLDVDREAVERHPVADAHADGGDLVLARSAVGQSRLVGTDHPDTDPAGAPLGRDAEAGEGADGPFLEVGHEAPHILAAARAGRAWHRPRAGPGRDRCIARRGPRHGRESASAAAGRAAWRWCRRCRAADAPAARPARARGRHGCRPHAAPWPSVPRHKAPHRRKCATPACSLWQNRYFRAEAQ